MVENLIIAMKIDLKNLNTSDKQKIIKKIMNNNQKIVKLWVHNNKIYKLVKI